MAQTAAPESSITLKLPADEAEAICARNGYLPTYELLGCTEDWGGALHGYPLFFYHVRCDLHLDSGVHIGQGNGSCSNWERKYRYRGGERTCPECGAAGTIIKGKPEYERDPEYKRRGAWLCFERRGGCGAKFFGDDPAMSQQAAARVENPDFADVVHVVRRMADKRALVAAVLNTRGFLEHKQAAAPRAKAPAVQPQATATAPPPPAPPPPPAAPDPGRALTGAEWAAQQPTLGQLRAQAAAIAANVGQSPGTQAAADAVARKKLARTSVFPSYVEPVPLVSKTVERLPANIARIEAAFAELRPAVSDAEFQAALVEAGGPNCNQLRDLESLSNYQRAYDRLYAIAAARKGAAA